MKRFKNILYILESADAAERTATARVQVLARRNNARVCLVRILDESLIEQIGKFVSPQMKQLAGLARQHLREELDRVLAGSGWSDISTTSEVLEGKDFMAAIQKVLRDDHDIVIKRATAAEGADQLAMRLFRKCPCPVWVLRDTASASSFTVLAALDLSDSRPENRTLNRKIVELAHSLAQREEGEAHLLHAIHLEFEGMMRGPRFNVDDAQLDEMRATLRRECRARLDRLLEEAEIEIPSRRIHLRNGEVSEVIARTLREENVDVLVMGTVARAGVPGLLIGNRAEKVLSRATCTVLAVKPDGFTSPVRG